MPYSPLYYARSNHTFLPLSENWEDALDEIRDEIEEEGQTYGTVYTKRFDGDPSVPDHYKHGVQHDPLNDPFDRVFWQKTREFLDYAIAYSDYATQEYNSWLRRIQ